MFHFLAHALCVFGRRSLPTAVLQGLEFGLAQRLATPPTTRALELDYCSGRSFGKQQQQLQHRNNGSAFHKLGGELRHQTASAFTVQWYHVRTRRTCEAPPCVFANTKQHINFPDMRLRMSHPHVHHTHTSEVGAQSLYLQHTYIHAYIRCTRSIHTYIHTYIHSLAARCAALNIHSLANSHTRVSSTVHSTCHSQSLIHATRKIRCGTLKSLRLF